MTDVMGAEDGQLCQRVCREFESRLTAQDRSLLEWFYDLRVDEVHITGAEVEQITRPARVMLGPFSPMVPGVLVPQITDLNGNKVDLVPAGRKCLELLEALIVDAERQAAATAVLPPP